MMQEAALRLGLRLRLLAEGPQTSAALAVPGADVGDFTDPDAVVAFAAHLDVVTFDHEHVPTDLLRRLADAGVAVRPGPDALRHAQDKAVMRARLTALEVPCPRWRVVASADELAAFAADVGWPVVAKTSRGGYDGKGVWTVRSHAEAAAPFAALAGPQGPTEARREADGSVVIVAEEYIDFARELSALVARRPGGEAVAYPVSETVQRDGICRETTTPAPGLDAARSSALQDLALRIADALGVVGILAVELMERRDGEVVVNELAMRPHNTGHWTIDGAVTSQFENHLRAVADWPLGATDPLAPVAVMSNVLGGPRRDLVGGLPDVLADPRVRVHLYGKSVTPGRKVGHVTVCGTDVAATRDAARAASALLEGVEPTTTRRREQP